MRHVTKFCGSAPRRLSASGASISTNRIAPPGSGPNHRSLLALDGNTIRPFVQPNAYVAPNASVIGSVVVNDKAAVMYGAVVRGDLALIHIGGLTVIGDNSTLNAGTVDGSLSPSDAIATGLTLKPALFVGDYTLVGANCALHSCSLQGFNVVGDGCVIEEGARIGLHSIVEPKSVVPADMDIPEGELWGGSPAQKIRELTVEEKDEIRKLAQRRCSVTREHAYEFLPVGTVYWEKEKVDKEKMLPEMKEGARNQVAE